MENNEYKMEFDEKTRETIIDFKGNKKKILAKLDFIMCASPWSQHPIYELHETKLLIDMICKKEIIIKEIYYPSLMDITQESINKATNYLRYLNNRKEVSTILESVHLFSKYEINVKLTDKLALYYPDIKAFVRCGDLDTKRFFELLEKEHCERIIIFNGKSPEQNNLKEDVFYLFEMEAPKNHISKRFKEFRKKQLEETRKILDKMWDTDLM